MTGITVLDSTWTAGTEARMRVMIEAGRKGWTIVILAMLLAGCAHLSPPDRDASQDYVQPRETGANPASPDQGGGFIKGFLSLFGR